MKRLICLLCIFLLVVGQDISVIKRVRECFMRDHALVCLKERALDVLNETIMNDGPLSVYGLLDIVKDPNYRSNSTDENLSDDFNQRSLQLNKILYDKVEEFFESRSVKISLANIFEGRAKKDKKGSMLMMGGLAMMGMMAQLFMGKIAFMAGAALLVAKMALMLSAIIGIKKLSSGGGGSEPQHSIVYTSSSDSGYGHSHGGGGSWHRSLNAEEAQNMAYGGYITKDANYSNY